MFSPVSSFSSFTFNFKSLKIEKVEKFEVKMSMVKIDVRAAIFVDKKMLLLKGVFTNLKLAEIPLIRMTLLYCARLYRDMDFVRNPRGI